MKGPSLASVFTPLLDTMSRAARIAWPFIQSGVEKGLGAEAIINAMRAADIATFRRQDMLALIREASGAELLKSDIRRWPSDVLMPITRIRESITKIVAPFSYTLRVTVFNTVTGVESTVLRQAHSSQLFTAGDVEADFMEDAPASDSNQGLVVADATVVDIQRSGAAGIL